MATNFHKQIENLENQFLITLRNDIGIKLHPDTYVIIQESRIEIGLLDKERSKETGLRYTLFGSQFNINYFNVSYRTEEKRIELNYGSSGAFSPDDIEDIAIVQRTLQSAEIVSNWKQIKKIVETYCSAYLNICEVYKNIKNENN